MPVTTRTPADLLGVLNDVEERNAPPRLYIAGDEELLRSGPRVSVVGSRRASAKGLERARAYARELVKHDVTVVSGLAEGVDTAAHEEAIRASGRTVAVLGFGLDRVYPAKNRALLSRIMEEHAAVSQFPLGTGPYRRNFPARNRVMALLTDATIIVEAGEASGTRHQGWEALRLGRALFLDRSLLDAEISWVAEMQEYGADIVSPGDLDIVLDELPHTSNANLELPF